MLTLMGLILIRYVLYLCIVKNAISHVMNYTLIQRNADFMTAVRRAAVNGGDVEEFSLENVIRCVLDGVPPNFM